MLYPHALTCQRVRSLPPALTAPWPYPTPRLLPQGTFYSQEYAYLSFKFSVNKTHPRFADSSIYTGGLELVGKVLSVGMPLRVPHLQTPTVQLHLLVHPATSTSTQKARGKIRPCSTP